MIWEIIVTIESLTILVLLFKLRRKPYDGSMLVTDTDEKTTFTLEIDVDPDTFAQRKTIVFQVKHFLEEVPRT